jgi:chromosome segregation ATPase
MSIKRYTVIFEEEHIGECETGKFVLYTDHLAVMKEKDVKIKQVWTDRDIAIKDCASIVGKLSEQIAALKDRNDKITLTIGDWVLECDALHEQIAALQDEINLNRKIAALQATIKAQAEYNTLELARIAQLQEKVEALQAEANRNIEELCRARAEKKDEYCQGCALPERVRELTEALEKIVNLPNNDYWDDEEIHSAIDIAKAALGGK